MQPDGIHAKAPAAVLMKLKGIGPEFAAVLWLEGLFRRFANRRQLAAYAGLAPSPWPSGSVDREQGIAQSGNAPPWLSLPGCGCATSPARF